MPRGLLAALLLAAAPAIAAPPEAARFHHAHIRVADVARTTAFYGKVFGTVPVQYGARTTALMADRAFVFMTPTPGPIPSQLQTGVIHLGWSGVDGPSEFAWWKAQGVEFYTPLTPFLGAHFMYMYGPDREVVELWTVEKHHRLNHVHLLATDPKSTAEWFAKVTGAAPPVFERLGNATVKYGDVGLHIFPDLPVFKPKERTGPIQPTDGAGIDHLAFSFRDLAAAHRRAKAAGVPIVRPIATDPQYGVKSFFVRAPNGVLVELVQARPLPDAAWD